MADILNPDVATRDPDFPQAPPEWSRESAEQAARADAIELGPDHWGTIKALQRYFASQERPNVRALHDALDEAFHSKGGIKYLYGLFPGGPVAQGCRFAGLHAPAGATDKSFGSVQ
jgi:TusE/DsrC/DsvC family sulfur relay protein